METKNSDFRGYQLRTQINRVALWAFLIFCPVCALCSLHAYYRLPNDRLAWKFMAGMSLIAGANAILMRNFLSSARHGRGVELFKK